MKGIVGDNEIYFSVQVNDRHGEAHYFTALLDTGYTGYLTLTPEIIEALGLEFDEEIPVRVGDGTVHLFRRYRATIRWAERDIQEALVHAVSGVPAIGMQLLDGGLLTIQCKQNGVANFDWEF